MRHPPPLLQPMYVDAVCILATFNTSPVSGVTYFPYMVLCTLFPMIYLRILTWVSYTVIFISCDMLHNSNHNNRTACIIDR